MPGQSVRSSRNPFLGGPARVKFTVAAEASNVIKVTAALKMANRADNPPADRQHVRAYLTESLSTLAVSGTAPSGTVVIAAKGSIVLIATAKLVFDIACDVNGEFDLNITNATARTYYLVVVVGNQVFASGAVAFAQPVVGSLDPTGGTTAGGGALTITGTGFESGATVDVGGAAATSVVVVSATSITCVTPARTAGAKAVTVTTPNGVSNTDVTFLYA